LRFTCYVDNLKSGESAILAAAFLVSGRRELVDLDQLDALFARKLVKKVYSRRRGDSRVLALKRGNPETVVVWIVFENDAQRLPHQGSFLL
jgi:hypothetical protein